MGGDDDDDQDGGGSMSSSLEETEMERMSRILDEEKARVAGEAAEEMRRMAKGGGTRLCLFIRGC